VACRRSLSSTHERQVTAEQQGALLAEVIGASSTLELDPGSGRSSASSSQRAARRPGRGRLVSARRYGSVARHSALKLSNATVIVPLAFNAEWLRIRMRDSLPGPCPSTR